MSTLFSQHKLIITHKMLFIVVTMHSVSASLLYYASKPGITKPGTRFGTQNTLMGMTPEYCLLEHEENRLTSTPLPSVTSTNVVFHLHSMSADE